MSPKKYFQADTRSALEAKEEALKIAFSPIIFQVSYSLIKLGILDLIGASGEKGMSIDQLAQELNLSTYGVGVLLDAALSSKLVWIKENKYILDKIGYFILCDSMVKTNLNFVQDICYQGLFYLLESIKTGKPEGLKVFGEWDTIYPALSSLPEAAKSSWFDFDHYYSDKIFAEALKIIFAKPVSRLIDVGGNTGKWAIECLTYDAKVKITLADLPEQLTLAKKILKEKNLANRVDFFPINLLKNDAQLPNNADVIWMSQFLDCFSEAEILSILQRTATAMSENTKLYIMELFWDRQTYEASAFSINCTSIYFTCIANGNSRMYHSKDLLKLIHQAGLYVDEDIDHIGVAHTLLGCKKKPI